MKLTIENQRKNKRVYDLVDELPDRVQAIIEHFPGLVAADFLEDVAARAPKGIERYPKMLQLRKMELKGVDSVAGIIAPGYEQSKRLRAADVTDTVIYVKPRSIGGAAPDAAASILAEHNPWTMSTLPFEPKKEQASLTSRRVSVKEVSKIEQRRSDERASVDLKLKEIGVVPARSHPTLIKRRVTRDIAFEVLRAEFGINAQHRAHLRPALVRVKKKHVRFHMKKLIRWLAVPSERRWKRRVQIRPEKASTARRLKEFQDHIASAGGR